MISMMLSSVANRTIVAASGNVYVADQYGVIQNVSTPADVQSLIDAGCAVLSPPPTDLLGSLLNANFNSTSDQLITFPLASGLKYRVKRIVVCDTTVNGMSRRSAASIQPPPRADQQSSLRAKRTPD